MIERFFHACRPGIGHAPNALDRGHARQPRWPPIFGRFLEIEAASGAVLLFFTVGALALSNSPWAHAFLNVWETETGFLIGPLEFTRSLREWINDALMTLFFFLVSLELKRELVLGELRSLRMASLSISASLGLGFAANSAAADMIWPDWQ